MNDKKKYLIFTIPILVLVIIFFSINNPPKNEGLEFASSFNPNLSPSSGPLPTEPAAEPIPYSWEKYDNDEFNFTLEYPSKWYKKEYKRNPKGGIFVAFSPDPLPCDDCSYLNSAFFSVKIYNREADPEAYAAFLQKIKAVGRVAGYQGGRLDGKTGVYHENIIAVENKDWVYELTLEKDLGNPGIEDSQIFKKVLSSFKFTYLIFAN